MALLRRNRDPIAFAGSANAPAAEHEQLHHARLPPQRDRRQRAPSMPGGIASRPQQRGRGKHRLVALAAGVDDARGGVERIAAQRDLLLDGADFADHDRAAMEGGAEIDAEAEFALEGGLEFGEAAHGVEAGGEAPRILQARCARHHGRRWPCARTQRPRGTRRPRRRRLPRTGEDGWPLRRPL